MAVFLLEIFATLSEVQSEGGLISECSKYSWRFAVPFVYEFLLLVKSKDVHLVPGSINEAHVSCADRCFSSVIHAVVVIDDLSTCNVRSIGQN